MIEIKGRQFLQWIDCEPAMRTELGYSRVRGDGLYVLLAYAGDEAWREGYEAGTFCWREGDPKPTILLDGMDDATVVFVSYDDAIRFLRDTRDEGWGQELYLVGLGDYWRHGDVPAQPLKYRCSRDSYEWIAMRGAKAG